MKTIVLSIVVLCALMNLNLFAQTIKFKGGQVFVKEIEFDNINLKNGFISKDFIVANGKIHFDFNEKIDTTIDLTSKWVIPPFADAHTHNLDRQWQLSYLPNKYLNEGCFYILNLTSKANGVNKLKPFFEEQNTPDVKFSLQGLTSEIGHPFMAYEPFAMGLNDARIWKDSIEKIKTSRLDEGNSYIFLNSIEEAKRKLPDYFEQKPDVVKIFLVNSNEYEENAFDDVAGNNGLKPEVAKYVTEEAHKLGYRVFAHISNAFDFELAVNIGVDVSAHLPCIGWDGNPESKKNYIVDDLIIDRAIAQDHAVITTLQWSYESFDTLRESKIGLAEEFLKTYHEKGGTILIGADRFGETYSDELRLILERKIFKNYDLIKIACSVTPRFIFPERKIGFIQDNFEADFLILDENPLLNIESLLNPQSIYKAGIKIK